MGAIHGRGYYDRIGLGEACFSGARVDAEGATVLRKRLAVFGGEARHWHEHRVTDFDFEKIEAEESETARRVQEATDLIERGARLRDVAAVMQIPMALRCVKPGAAHLACPLNADWIMSLMPDSLPRMRT